MLRGERAVEANGVNRGLTIEEVRVRKGMRRRGGWYGPQMAQIFEIESVNRRW